jgi:hypothetical protein
MIISHEHKFIFLKTKKTAGTAIEAALSELCGPSDVITPYREESEQDRKGLPPQNYRIDHPLQRPLIRGVDAPRALHHPSVGYYEHIPASRVRDYVGGRYGELFQVRLRPQPMGPAGRGISTRPSRARPPSFEHFATSRARAYVSNHDIYMLNGALAV